MIGVVADPGEHVAVREFFELFKTPWEFYREGRDYEVLLCSGEPGDSGGAAGLTLIYSGAELAYDDRAGLAASGPARAGETLRYRGAEVPVYGRSLRFCAPGELPGGSGEPIVRVQEPASRQQRPSKQTVRLGYDLFQEVAYLLSEGQPVCKASVPALDLHIAILRDLMVASGAAFTEIPAVPAGYSFIACLTHDVDHPSIRRHGLDHTVLGFLYRAVVGSVERCRQGRLGWRGVLRNWAAALKLPLVQMRLAGDFWEGLNRYCALEQGAPSTFFVIPFGYRTGRLGEDSAPAFRMAGYGANDIAKEFGALHAAGCEVATHGIDAWCDTAAGREELAELWRASGRQATGIRMHWLYFDKNSPVVLEEAGFTYDSTCGYNETVGYRAGTSQAFRPPRTKEFLELPLHVMDTALFYPQHLNLSPAAAKEAVGRVVRSTARLGGCVTLNWHDRSLAPERLWGEFYGELVGELKQQGAWLASAEQVVAWFRQRRAMEFRHGAWEMPPPAAGSAAESRGQLPGMQVRVHNGSEALQRAAATVAAADCVATAQ